MQHHHSCYTARRGQGKDKARQGEAGQGQDTAVIAGLELDKKSSRTKYLPGTHVVPHSTCRCCGLFYGLLLVLVVSTASAQTPSLINQDCRPCSHQNSEPPSIERHRHLIFFFCQLLLESSPSLPGSRHSSFSFFYFVPSIPVSLFLFHCPIQRIGPRRLRRN